MRALVVCGGGQVAGTGGEGGREPEATLSARASWAAFTDVAPLQVRVPAGGEDAEAQRGSLARQHGMDGQVRGAEGGEGCA